MSVGSFNNQHVSFSDLLDFTELSKPVKQHVATVYSYLTGLVVCGVVGCFLNVAYAVGGWGTGLLSLGCMLYVLLANPKAFMRAPALMAFGLLNGMSLGPLVGSVISFDPSLVLTALLATSCIFVCFSLAAYFADQRLHLYLAGFIGTGTMILLLFSLLSVFGLGGRMAFNVQLYLGLLVFLGYIVYDTQVMVARASRGIKDPLVDSLNLFVDFVAVFVRILIILAKNKKKD